MEPNYAKYIILGLYFIALFLIGIFASRRIKGMSDFYVGGKNLGYWMVAFSARVTGESGWLLLGLTGMGAAAGLSAYWVVVGELLGVGISWFFMAKPFKNLTDKYHSITIPDYLDSHFKTTDNKLRIIAATALSLFVIIFVSAQIDATGKAFFELLDVSYHQGAIAGFLIVCVYIFSGGFVAVVWSDFFQGLLMFFGLLALPIIAWFFVDKGADILGTLREMDPGLVNIWGVHDTPWMNVAALLGFAMIGLGFLGSPQIYVRFIAVRNDEEIDKGKWVAIAFTLLTDAAAVTIGILGRYLFTEAGQDPETVLGPAGENVIIVMVETLLPSVLAGVYIAIILAAIMSTIDSLLVVASSAITRDFYQHIFRPDLKDKQLANMSRWVTLAMALIALGIAFTVKYLSPDRTVFWYIIFGWSGIAATFCPVIILSLFWKRFSERGAIAAMVTGFFSVPFFKFYVQNLEGIGPYFVEMDVLFPSFVLAMLAGWVFNKRKKEE